MPPRPWHGWADLPQMQDLLARSLRDRPHESFVHPGDLAWWLGWFPKTRAELAGIATLWEEDGRVVAWAVIDEGDVGECVDPSQPSLTDAIDAWLAQRPEGITRYVRDDDREGVARLERAGYRPAPEEEMVGFSLDLDGLGPIEPDPRVSAVTRDDDLRPRLSVTHAGFGVDRPFELYVKGYEAFMDSPAYPSGWDLVAWNRDGRAAACCIAWPDPDSHVGNFEPVATHPEFHRQGFGTTVMRDGLRRLRDAGMTRAIVRTVRSNQAAMALYRSVGFADDHVQRAFRRA